MITYNQKITKKQPKYETTMQKGVKMQKISREEMNKGRQIEVDIAKAIVLLYMPAVHCTIECIPEEGLISGIPYWMDSILGGPFGAPVFIFAMGLGMAYTKKNKVSDLCKRGLLMLGISYLLNVCRFLIPYLIGYAMTGEKQKYIEPLFYRVLGNDVLQFAGCMLLFFALLKALKLSDEAIWGMSVLMSVLAQPLNGLDVQQPIWNNFLGYLIGIEDAAGKVFSDFPLLNWMIVPMTGYLFGKRLIFVQDKDTFYRKISPICLLVAVTYCVLGIHLERGMFGEGQNCYYHIMTDDVIVSIIAVLGMLGVYYKMSKWLPKKVLRLFQKISQNITAFYCIHWVLVVISTNVVLYIVKGTQQLQVSGVMLLSLIISIITVILVYIWSELKQLKK